jgi:hypothetical protein
MNKSVQQLLDICSFKLNLNLVRLIKESNVNTKLDSII